MSVETALLPKEVAPLPLHERFIVAVQERLFPAYFKDELTGLGNRAAFNRELNRKVHNQPGNFALLDADLNGLKRENDLHGHDAGDDLIQLAGTIINESIRTEDDSLTVGTVRSERRRQTSEGSELDQTFKTRRRWLGRVARSETLHKVFRWGGDEYRAVLSGVNDPEVVVRIIERIEKNLADADISASIGFAVHEVGMTGTALSAQADASMYAAKRKYKAQERQAKIAARPPYLRAIFHLGEFLTRKSGVIESPR